MGRKKGSAQSSLDQNLDLTATQEVEVEANPKKNLSFKNKALDAAKNNPSSKKLKASKNFKQIVLHERSLQWTDEDMDYAYSFIDAHPSFKPQKKYSDISGIPALYTDPHSKLRYANSEEFSRIKTLPSDIVSGLLNLRKANGCNS